MKLPQFIAERSAEVGIQRQYLDGELRLVDDSLAGTVPAAEQLQVFNSVVAPDTVDVVDSFVLPEIAPKMLGHGVSMFHNVPLHTVSGEFGQRHPNVAVTLGMFFVAATFESFKCNLLLSSYFAIVATVFLLTVDSPACFAVAMFFFAALLAFEFVALIRILAATAVGTEHRAVKRVFTEFLAVRGKVSLPHGERLGAFLTRKRDQYVAGRRTRFVETVSTSALKAAILAPFFNFVGIAVKRLLAVFARHLDGHIFSLSFGNEKVLGMSVGVVK